MVFLFFALVANESRESHFYIFPVSNRKQKVAEYNGDTEGGVAEHSYQFGSCNGEEEHEDDETSSVSSESSSKDGGRDNNDCFDVTLDLTLDEFPSETGYNLICDNQIFWRKPPHSFLTGSGDAHAFVEERACIDTSACCTFTILDECEDGLTSGGFEIKDE